MFSASIPGAQYNGNSGEKKKEALMNIRIHTRAVTGL